MTSGPAEAGFSRVDIAPPPAWPGMGWAQAQFRDGRPRWTAVIWAVLAGAVSALGFAPFSLTFVFVPAFAVLIRLVDRAETAGCAFRLAWWFAFGQFVFGLWWIANALLVDAAQFWWMVPITVLALPAALALFPAVAILIAKRLCGSGLRLALGVALAWSLAELARGFLFTGFPWNLVGQSWGAYPLMAQTASLYGIYGLSLATVLAAVLLAVARPRPAAAGAVLLGALFVFGLVRMPAGPVATSDTLVRLVQPNVPQAQKWDRDLLDDHIQTLVDLTLTPPADGNPVPDIVIWPETALPLVLSDGSPAFRLMERLSETRSLVTGAIRLEDDGERRLHNSLFLFEAGRLAAVYDKHHLVPFGEYVPFQDQLSFMRVAARVNFTPGPGPQRLETPNVPAFSPLICYEVIFPGQVVPDAAAGRPDWLVNLTNDAWYGYSSGPFQHLVISRFRAIEQGMPLVRVANTGISALIDPYGRKIASLDLQTRGIIDESLPTSLNSTIFERVGWALLLAMYCAVSIGIATFPKHTK